MHRAHGVCTSAVLRVKVECRNYRNSRTVATCMPYFRDYATELKAISVYMNAITGSVEPGARCTYTDTEAGVVRVDAIAGSGGAVTR